MSERSKRISRLRTDRQSRQSYVFSKLGVLVPSQIKALRLKSPMSKQEELAKAAGTHQSRLSTLEQPGALNVTLETLAWIASIHKVGVIVKFVSFSEMLAWENSYSQDHFNVTRLEHDTAFLEGHVEQPQTAYTAAQGWVGIANTEFAPLQSHGVTYDDVMLPKKDNLDTEVSWRQSSYC